MIPGDIGPHPDFPNAYRVFKAPPGSEGWCGDLAVRIAHNAAGFIGFMSEWHPSDEERARIAAGAPIRTYIIGESLPPQSVWVPEPDEL